MNFIDNFKISETDNHVGIVNYVSTKEFKASPPGGMFDETTAEAKTLYVNLESYTVTGVMPREQQVESQREFLQNRVIQVLKNELTYFILKELLKKSLDNAREIDSHINFTGLKKFIFSIFKYSPRIWINSDTFLCMVESTKIRNGWLAISPKNLQRFLDSSKFQYSDHTMSSSIPCVMFHGLYGDVKVYTSHLMADDEILMGKSSKPQTDDIIGIMTSKDEWLSTEIMTGETKIGLRKMIGIYIIPDTESYVKWRFSTEKPNIWTWIKKELFT